MKTSSVANEWRAEGRTENQRENLRFVIRDRFGSVPDAIAEAIRATTDMQTLERWFGLSLRSELPELLQQISS